MPVPAMTEPLLDHHKRFQAAVDVIHNLPKNGSYRPSYDVMLRFYSLYKQAVCGPCSVPRPGFWDPVGRYKWDAWSRLGEMSSESAMEAYVEEMKKVAQEVIHSMPMDERTASLLHHFEPLYLVIDDMPRPPASLLSLREAVKGSDLSNGSMQRREQDEEQLREPEEEQAPAGEPVPVPVPAPEPEPEPVPDQDQNLDLTANIAANDSGLSEGLLLTSDSESEVFCDSLDSVEQLSSPKVPGVSANGLMNGHISEESKQEVQQEEVQQEEVQLCVEARQVGAGQGGEGADDGRRAGPNRRGRDVRRESSHHSWRERGAPQGSPRRAGASGGGASGAGRGGGDSSEGDAERLQEAQLQQQIVVALRRLREDMRSVVERLEVVERLAAAHSSEWRLCPQCLAVASKQQQQQQQEEEGAWPLDVSAPTLLLLLLWPFVAQGLMLLLRRAQRRGRLSS